MYELPRQLQLIKSINWSVVRASPEQIASLKELVAHCESYLLLKDLWVDSGLLAEALDRFRELVEELSTIGGLPFTQNRWLLEVAEKLLFWFGPEEEIKARWGSFEEWRSNASENNERPAPHRQTIERPVTLISSGGIGGVSPSPAWGPKERLAHINERWGGVLRELAKYDSVCGEKATITKRCQLPKGHPGAHDEDP